MLKIRLTQSAINDLDNIWAYTLGTWGERQADKYMGLLEQAFLRLLENPLLGKTRPDIKTGYRALAVEQHIIFYRADDDYLDILGVLHSRMDAVQHLT